MSRAKILVIQASFANESWARRGRPPAAPAPLRQQRPLRHRRSARVRKQGEKEARKQRHSRPLRRRMEAVTPETR
eukprot:1153328-Pyramimonas_sp.AAC.1